MADEKPDIDIVTGKPLANGVHWADDDEFITYLRRTMLPELDKVMPRVIVRGLPDEAAKAQRKQPMRSNAYTAVGLGDPHIYVNNYTPEYEGAKAGDVEMMKKLASILAHENAHIYTKEAPATLPDEVQAYDVQLDMLRQLAANDKVIQDVQRSRDAVAKKWGKR